MCVSLCWHVFYKGQGVMNKGGQREEPKEQWGRREGRREGRKECNRAGG